MPSTKPYDSSAETPEQDSVAETAAESQPHADAAPPATVHGGATARILKLMGVFGSVQMVQMLCSVIRTKIVALWIGAAGIGLLGLFTSAFEMLSIIAQMGLRNSATRDLAAAPRSRLAELVLSVRRWGLVLGIAGALLTLALSAPLSIFSFGDTSHWWSFALLGVAVMLTTFTASESAVFQGIGKLRKLAVGSLWGTIGGLVISVPMYRIWGTGSIIPSIIAYTVCAWFGLGLHRARVKYPEPKPAFGRSLAAGKQFIVLGIYLTLCEFMTMLVAYIFMSWLNRTSGNETVGHFQAGFTIANKYLGLIFTALALEYYPRLSAMVRSHRAIRTAVSHETVLVMLMVIPAATLFITCADWAVWLLYKKDFDVIVPFVTWAAVGTVFRAISWCMSFTMLARGDGRTYLVTDGLSCVIYLACNIVCYRLWGVPGMGIAYMAWYFLYLIIISWVYFHRYRMKVSAGAIRASLLAVGIVTAAAAARTLLGWQYAAGIALIASVFSLRGIIRLLRKRK